MGYRNNNDPEPCVDSQKHVHELQGSVKLAGRDDPHGHRFCTVTGEAIAYGEHDHIHEVVFRTDSFNGHYHEFCGKTGCAVYVGNRHVHFIDSVTSVEDGHKHCFEVATLIENPTGSKKEDHRHREDHNRKEYHNRKDERIQQDVNYKRDNYRRNDNHRR